ncbi:MAG: 1,4-alpha-glucan branching enzyme [Gammaproteobacteria bacterium RIFCSPLOWO2_02_FULL_57_10]|nr:MAG: 1,4-alpha-glucan branching enzyme [Gammaproteobacteria bacterium RIFCSPLOWO2_02_FULL_57_10]
MTKNTKTRTTGDKTADKKPDKKKDAGPLLLQAEDLYLFSRGEQERAYRFLGANHYQLDGVDGVLFAVWAPNASQVSVVGDFNHWQPQAHIMHRHPGFGVWELFVPGVVAGMHYKYQLVSEHGVIQPWKADPYAKTTQLRPETASVVPEKAEYEWQDSEWLQKRAASEPHVEPMLVYEVHLGSWRRHWHDNSFLDYRELAHQLVAYVKEMGFTHIQLMPVSEFPFDGSWGYQPIGLFAPTRRFGTPDEFRYFVDHAHQQGIGIFLDWVPAHFPSDEHGLARFDGSHLYEHADPRQGYHPDWNTLIFNFGRAEVISYLLSNAIYWLDEFHLDGLRFDAVASMLYLNYSRKDGEWLPNHYGGIENLEAIHLLREINQRAYQNFPGIAMIAEESTAWPGVTDFTSRGGLGFGFKWNLGWMNDTLRYMARDPIHRKYHHSDMSFGLLYAFSESFILALSHDEVVHGKRSLIEKMPGDDWQKFANLRAYLAFMWTHPGRKLLFMGGEFAQRSEWNHDKALDWQLLDWAPHRGVQQLVRDLNRTHIDLPVLYKHDDDSECFEWIDSDSGGQSVFAFVRRSPYGSAEKLPVLVAVCNMTPTLYSSWRVGVPEPGFYREVLNTDSVDYGGSGAGNMGGVHAHASPCHGREFSIEITVPPLATVLFTKDH